MKRSRLNLPTRVILLTSAVMLIINIVLGLTLMNQSRQAMKTLIDERMMDTAKTAAAMLDGDTLESLTAEDIGTEKYNRQYQTLSQFQDHLALGYIYAVRKTEADTYVFIIDPDKKNAGEYGKQVPKTEALVSAGQGVPAVDTKPYTDDFGRFYSAYTPVYNSSGKIAAIVAADFPADWYDGQLNKNARTIIIACLASLLIGALILIGVTNHFSKKMKEIAADLSELAADIDSLTTEYAASRQDTEKCAAEDDIQALGARIASLRDELRTYVSNVQRQVHSMAVALSSDYRSVYYIDLDKDDAICLQDQTSGEQNPGEHFHFQQFMEKYAQQCVTPEYREGLLSFIKPENIRQGLEKDKTISFLYTVKRSGQEVYELFRLAGIRPAEQKADDKRFHAISAGFTDVDAETRKALEQKEVLRNALTAAEEASKAKTAFLSNTSHEIRTPMNAIIGLNNIALNDPETPEKIRGYLLKIGASAEHLLNLINDILDMSRIESGRLVLKNEEFSFNKLLETVNTIFSGQCQDKGLEYRSSVKGEIGSFYIGDNMKLRQVLINILGNAVKFTPSGGKVELLVQRLAQFDSKSTLQFIISDTGIGISPEFLPHLFDAFSQENDSATNKYGSSGLGMAITKNIVEMMNGNIQVESVKGQGTKFSVLVTLGDSDRQDSEHDDSLPCGDLAVLLIDDDEVAREHAKLVLNKVGIAAETAVSGPEAAEKVKLRQARREPYDLIMVDLQMPEVDGLETSRQLREIVGSDSAIILQTSFSWDNIHNEAVNAGVDGFVAKPFTAATVLEEFKSAAKRRHITVGKRQTKAELAGRRLLLAEDVAINAEIMIMVLQTRDVETDLAENGKIAVEKFSAHPAGYYDAILMDVCMPEMDGLEATKVIRGLDRPDAKTIPIIALTANAFDEDVQKSLQAGLNAHLSKPVESQALFATLESLIKP